MYFLAKHAFACAVQDHVVILDVKHDSYCAIPPRAAHWLKQVVADWPAIVHLPSHVFWPPETELLKDLLGRGVLTTDAADGHPAPLPTVPSPVLTLASYADPASDRLSPAMPDMRSLFRFVISCLHAKYETQCRPLRGIVAALHGHGAGSILEEPDISRARELVSTYRTWRPLFFGNEQQCLFYSLSLLRFLEAHGIRAGWVFGVQLAPFAAHCWLQQGTVVFNDRIEMVRRFTPIMVV